MDTHLELTFLGHQTWLIQGGGHRVLIDPVLKPTFGLPGRAECQVWPPRDIDAGLMPRPDAVVLTHEHLDHFHLPSLDLLDRQVPVYSGPLLPVPVEEAIVRLGFEVRRVDHTQPIVLGDLGVTLYPAGAQTLFWEDRVVQPCLRVGDGPAVFIAVDADPSDLYLQQVAEGVQPVPRMAVVSNNSQIVPPGMPASSINLLPGRDGTRHKTGLSVLNQLLLEVLAPLDGVADVALCGNGFLPPGSPHGPFLYSDHPKMATAANGLQSLFHVHGPRPGERLTVPASPAEKVTSDQVGWVRIDNDVEYEALVTHAAFLADPGDVELSPLAEPPDDADQDRALTVVKAELPRLGRELLATGTGMLACSIPEYLSGPLGPHRAVLRLKDGPGGKLMQFAWDVATADFVQVEATGREEAMTAYPFGAEMFFQDYLALLQGRLQVWDVAGGAMECWHIGRPLDSLVYAFFGIYGEHQRPDLAALSYVNLAAGTAAPTGAQ
ncbi:MULTISPECIES: MBL fold metallo-hydrolase [unclassified Streptomyces]|uniref:MBL fold metallo-hydrolase n=1 Tax=unclassified Streptomyces TaxID=2593676 RepID=UPI0020246FF9|nr:MBL fold metallo-hydrolase [Streptomyces sp. A 4/2]